MVDSIKSIVQFLNREEEEQMAQALAQKENLEYVNLVDYNFAPNTLRLIPMEMVKEYLIIAYLRSENIVKVACVDPNAQGLKDFLHEFGKVNNLSISLSVCSITSYRYASKVYDLTEQTAETEEQIKTYEKETREKFFSKQLSDKKELATRLASANTTQLLDMIFAGALGLNSSDIHIEPIESGTVIRFRIDGVLQDIVNLNLEQYKLIRSRIKYLAKMKLNITDVAQDGRFEYNTPQEDVDVRVSAVPTAFGESFVMRLLRNDTQAITLENLGFSREQIAIIEKAISKPNGIIINTGPTGSGKTTTLYAILQKLNKPGVKIITAENPIEYKIEGITQTQIEPDKGYDFNEALKAAMRQDPDVIMVGEVRDADTAETAIRAAITGHLVLTTLHTNNASSAIPRLLDIGAKPYLLAGNINLIIAQRLVRKVVNPNAQGDERYSGRIAICELLIPTNDIETLIQKKASSSEIEQAAKKAGMKTLFEDGMTKAQAGITTEEEVRRVALESRT